MVLVHLSLLKQNTPKAVIPNFTLQGLTSGHPDAVPSGPPPNYDTNLLQPTSPPSDTSPSNIIVVIVILKRRRRLDGVSNTMLLHASRPLLSIAWQNTVNLATRTSVLLITHLILVGILCEKHAFGGLMIMTFIL